MTSVTSVSSVASGWGDPLYPSTPSAFMAKLIRKHNEAARRNESTTTLPAAGLHDLRHVHATTHPAAGVPVHVVAARLGHADPAITLRVYAHVIAHQAVTAAEIFATAVDEAAA